jgi:hypothetical protein
MKHISNNGSALSNRARGLRTELARQIASFIGPKEKLITDVPGLLLSRRTARTAPATAGRVETLLFNDLFNALVIYLV